MSTKNLAFLLLFVIVLPLSGQGYPGTYPLDDRFTRGLLTRAFNMPQDVITFGVYWNDLANTFYESNQFSNSLGSITSIDYHTTSPDLLVADYQDRIRTLNSKIGNLKKTNDARIQRDVRNTGEALYNMAQRNNITTKNSDLDWLIKEGAIAVSTANKQAQNERQMAQIKREAEQALRSNLKAMMDPIKASVIADNQRLSEDYLKSAAYEADERREEYFLACYKFHNCFVDEVNNKYSIYSAEWMTPACQKPRMFYATTVQTKDYIGVAYRKKSAYSRNHNPDYLEATRMYLEAGLSENSKNPDAFKLMSELESNVIDKRFYALMATNLDQTNYEIKQYSSRIDREYTTALFSAIRSGDADFVKKSVKVKFHMGQTYKNKSTIEQAIDYDQQRILKILVDAMPNSGEFIKQSGHALVFHASAVNAPQCIRLLSSYGVQLDYADPSNRGVTALNIAVKNKSKDAADYLYGKFSSYLPGLKFASHTSREELNNFSLYLYDKSKSNLSAIESVQKDFINSNYGSMAVRVHPQDADVYLDGSYVGNGTVEIDDLLLSKAYTLKVQKRGLQSSSRSISLKAGQTAKVEVTLQQAPAQKKKSLSTYSPGYELKKMSDYYEVPASLKKDNKRNKEFNDSQIKAAEGRAQRMADEENKKIWEKLESKNQMIAADNVAIEKRNNQLEAGRLFVVDYGSNNGVSSSASVSTKSAGSSVKSGSGTVEKKTIQTVQTSYTPAKKYQTTQTVLKSAPSDHSTPGPVQHVESTSQDPINEPLIFSLDPGNDKNGWSVFQIRNNKSLKYDKSSATVLIESENGVLQNFSNTYKDGMVQFYPFQGKGTYSVNIALRLLDPTGQQITKHIHESIDVREDPNELMGEIERTMGNYVYFECIPDRVVYTGMQVTVSRITAGELSQIASGVITYQTEKQWTIELGQISFAPDHGDLILIQ